MLSPPGPGPGGPGAAGRAGAVRTRAGARRLALRWVHLLLGGALLMPFFLLSSVLVGLATGAASVPVASVPGQLAAYALALPGAALVGLSPLVRPLSVTAVRALGGVAPERLADTPARSWSARRRAAGWFTLHTGVGALVSGATLAGPPATVVLVATPFSAAVRTSPLGWPVGSAPWLGPAAGLLLLAVPVGAAAGAGRLLARCAPALLGPTPADRLAAAEERAERLAVRNRLARELHDAVGHALSAVTLQAGAARRVLDHDPAFVREALAAIETTTREAVAELDSVLGMLREEAEDAGAERRAPAPTLAALPPLLAHVRAAGAEVTVHAPENLDAVPAVVSREAYRIVQEGLSNALRYAAPGPPVRLELTQKGEQLTITLTNAVPGAARRGHTDGRTGGRGLRGMAERAALLGGTIEAGPCEDGWRVAARLPLRGAR
ncbi:sensor histidine kinase [Streptomyces sp. GSL17-111]|uniref:sensor histidine kinase n=1 Tax=Streptomyces sp. GSL17-111 TaxID=3121596 RepID=UPI0030F43183